MPPGPDRSPDAARLATVCPAEVLTGYSPGGLNQSLTVSSVAFSTPTWGSMFMMLFQTSPEAVMLKAIGMNTTVLKAVAQRMRSVITANTSPRKVSRKGATTTQITLLRKVTRMSAVEKTVL